MARAARPTDRESPAHERFEQRAAELAADRRRTRLWWVLSAALLALLVYVVGFSSLLSVRTVEVTGADRADQRTIQEIVDAEQGRPLARVDTDGLAARVEQEPGVESASVERGWPRTLRVDVVPRIPALAVSRGEGKVEIYDLGGVLIRTVRAAPEGVPLVEAESGATVTGRGVSAARSMLESLPGSLRGQVGSVTVDAADRVSFTVGRTTVVWGDGSQPDLKVQVIEVLLTKKPKVLDVSAPSTPVTR